MQCEHMPKQEAPKRDLLEGHPRYRKLKDLNEGTFGVVMLALDVATNERVRSGASTRISDSSWHAQLLGSPCGARPCLAQASPIPYCFKQVAIKFLERGAGIGRGVLREVLNHR